MQAPMEALPVGDGTLDAVLCVYCFHEMPEEARAAAAAEWFRCAARDKKAWHTHASVPHDRTASVSRAPA
jgi:protein-disulfide isomerase